MLQIITNPYTIDKLNRNLAFYVTYKKKESLDLSYYAKNNIENYSSISQIPEENINYLNNEK